MQRRTLLGASPLLLAPTLLHAQSYPANSIHYIVPLAFLGASDQVVR